MPASNFYNELYSAFLNTMSPSVSVILIREVRGVRDMQVDRDECHANVQGILNQQTAYPRLNLIRF